MPKISKLHSPNKSIGIYCSKNQVRMDIMTHTGGHRLEKATGVDFCPRECSPQHEDGER